MRFEELDQLLRVYETATDRSVPPGFFIVARLDGRGFTRLTKELMEYEAPYDERFRDAMLAAMEAVMGCGFKVLFSYAQSDEISLLFDPREALFERKHRKWLSILAAEASVALSMAMGRKAIMDCRVIELPSLPTVLNYFRWRMEDASRNCLNSHCYWMLRKSGSDSAKATKALMGISTAQKHQILFDGGLNFNDLPVWQKRGYGMAWETYQKDGINPVTGANSPTERRRLAALHDLPLGENYARFIEDLLRPCQ